MARQLKKCNKTIGVASHPVTEPIALTQQAACPQHICTFLSSLKIALVMESLYSNVT
jgi:hypothetical protein